MNKSNNIERIGSEPDMDGLQAELARSISEASGFTSQMEVDYRTRFCLWDGQSRDGRKWKKNIGSAPFPWDGASDVRIRAADEIINEHVKVMKAAWRRHLIQVTARRMDSMGRSQRVTQLLTWLFKTRLRFELEREVERLAQWRQMYGLAVMGIFWDTERQLEMQQIDAFTLRDEAIQRAYMQRDPGALLMLEMMSDPAQEERVVEMIYESSPIIDRQRARKILRDLRTMRVAEVPRVTIVKSLPKWQALRPFVDVFWSSGAPSIQEARFVAQREWVSETDITDRIDTDGWDEEFVEKAIEHKGKRTWQSQRFLTGWIGRQRGMRAEDDMNLIEIFHYYYRGIDVRTGVPALYCTVMSPCVRDKYAKHDLSAYDHGQYPYVEAVREWIDPDMLESRSVADVARTDQFEIKAQRDARTDRTSIATLPPAIVPLRHGKTRLEFGPGAQHTERRAGELRWMPTPPYDPGSIEIEDAAWTGLARYFGRYSEKVAPVLAQLHNEDLAVGFLGEMQQCALQTLQLAQQYMDPVVTERIVGPQREPFQISREEIQGQFDLQLIFDPRDLDLELVKAKLEMFREYVLLSDTTGTIDRSGFSRIAAQWIDPFLAEQLVTPPEVASEREVSDEKANFALIMAGTEPEMKKEGQNYQLRLQVLSSLLHLNPMAAQRIQAQPDSMAMYQNRLKHLAFMVQQQSNAQTGRVGAQPALQPQQQV